MAKRITYDTLLDLLVERVPELAPALDEEERRAGQADPAAGLCVLAWELLDPALPAELLDAHEWRDAVRRFLEFVEEALAAGDPDVGLAIDMHVVGLVGGNERIADLLGPALAFAALSRAEREGAFVERVGLEMPELAAALDRDAALALADLLRTLSDEVLGRGDLGLVARWLHLLDDAVAGDPYLRRLVLGTVVDDLGGADNLRPLLGPHLRRAMDDWHAEL